MIFRLCGLLLFIAVFGLLPESPKPSPDTKSYGWPESIERPEVISVAIQYRAHLSRLVESAASLQASFTHIAYPPALTAACPRIAVGPLPASDPCYGLMSMQL